ncbi:hypothetical protein [Pseudoduganella aquatica]|uniref:Uncharacterized protein n=1 Tax=Pseudoduganella aquatica TaxID=2660641 RepID=A0A7X4KPB8_9BURK|nr:hypothetical protein [Pseudoduganella aquatica]MYN09026.1 hypothetical protein [Pseudoduganella aquatica]
MKIGLMPAPSWAPVPRVMQLMMALQLLVVLPFALLEPSATQGAGLALFTQSCLCMGLHCLWEMERLRTSSRRLHGMRAPSAAWRGSAAGYLKSITLAWIIFSAGPTLCFAMPASGMHWITGGSVLSLMCCLSAAGSLRRSGITQRGWPLAAVLAAYTAVAVLAMIFAGQFVPEQLALMAWLDLLPTAVQWAMLLSWPVTALLLHRQWRAQPPASAAPDLARAGAAWPTRSGWRKQLEAQWRRYGFLSKKQAQTGELLRPLAPALRASYLLLVPLTALLWLRSSWGTSFPQSEHLLPMVVVIVMSSDNLIMRDLHWRHRLAPGGIHTRSIALNLFFSSLAVYLVLTLLLGLCVLGLLCLAGRLTTAQALNELLLRTLIVPELAFSLACAVALKSMGNWTVAGAGIAAALFSLPLLREVVQYPGRHARIDGNAAYCAILLLLTAGMLLLARRTWTVQKLAPYWQAR